MPSLTTSHQPSARTAGAGAQRLDRRSLLRYGAFIFAALALVLAFAEYGAFAQTGALQYRNRIGLFRATTLKLNTQVADVRGMLNGLGLGDGVPDETADSYHEQLAVLYDAMPTSLASAAAGDAGTDVTLAVEGAADELAAYIEASEALEPLAHALADVDSPDHEAADGLLGTWQDSYDALTAELTAVDAVAKPVSDKSVTDGEATGSKVKWLVSIGGLIAVALLVGVWRKLFRTVEQSNAMQAEVSRVSSMVENSPNAMLFCDTELVVRYVNPAMSGWIGRLSGSLSFGADAVIGRTLDEAHASGGRLQSIARSGALPETVVVEIGSETIEVTVSATKDEAGQPSGVMASWNVITDAVRLRLEAEAGQERERSQASELQSKVDELVAVVTRAAAGDLTVTVPVSGGGAIGQMGTALAKLLGDLRRSISSIAGNSEGLAAAAEELQAVATQMGANSAETSQQVNLVTGASTEVSRNVDTVSAGAEELSASIKEIARNASDAAKVATQAVEAAKVTNETVAQLGDSSAEIGQIVKVITGIAQQTNLLALNATIEAARAGEAGKGFAVVANEVKELAKETAKATEDISAKIGAIQADTQRSVESITGILAIIDQIAEFQDTIASAVEQQAATTSEIAHSVNDAARGSMEITANMQGVSQAAEGAASGALDSRRAATELARMASDLQGLVDAFTY